MTRDQRRRAVVRAAFGAYLVALVFVLLVPWGDVPSEGVGILERGAARLGAPDVLLVPGRIEFLANIVVFVPVTAGAAWARPQVRWGEWTGWGFLASLSVEGVQALLLSERSATFADVVANTSGAFLGSLLGLALRHWYVAPRRTSAGR